MPSKVDKAEVMKMLKSINEESNYKNFYFPGNNQVKIFLQDGSIITNLTTGKALMEKVKRRPLFREMNYLHYNPIKWFTLFSDLFAGALILLAITGLFLLKGKKGIKGRGAWLTALGIIIPIVFLIIYFY
ncbi:MAG: PepSY-associated TM helix domain-containing protein [Bacteroidales bacterium]|nr:PepSY-associated TM helix domain-containing protein [Bacteroidales bacterium]